MASGTIIRLIRTSDGVSQTALADKLGVTRTYLSQIENGKKQPGLSFLKEASRVLHIPIALLLVDESEPNSEIFKELRRILADLLASRVQLARKRRPALEN